MFSLVIIEYLQCLFKIGHIVGPSFVSIRRAQISSERVGITWYEIGYWGTLKPFEGHIYTLYIFSSLVNFFSYRITFGFTTAGVRDCLTAVEYFPTMRTAKIQMDLHI